MNLKFSFFICFLIISCDLPNEADVDCNRDNNGSAYIDSCGECVGGNTNLTPNHNMNLCGECYGLEVEQCSGCGTSSAINYIDSANALCQGEDCINHDESLCVYDMCTDYLPGSLSSSDYSCDEDNSANAVYEIGEQLRCDDIEKTYSMCYPENCGSTFKLADFYGKAIWIEMTASW